MDCYFLLQGIFPTWGLNPSLLLGRRTLYYWATWDAHSPPLGKVKLVIQFCPTLCDPMDCSPSGSSVHGILQAGILEWVAISFSSRSSWPRDQTSISCRQPPELQAHSLPTEPPGKPTCQCRRWDPGREHPLVEEMVTHFSILAGMIPWTEEPGDQW